MSGDLITIARARELILAAVRWLPVEPVSVEDALGRVLAADVKARSDVPPFPCSAMDGYAVQPGGAGRTLTVVGESRAGTPAAAELHEGEAIRISTGAALPAGAAAVIPQEQVATIGGRIETQAESAPGQHVRAAGEDMPTGTTILRAGMRLGAVELGAATAAGAGKLHVSRRPRVAVLCTGDELRPPGARLGPGEIHNSNAPMLVGLARGSSSLTSPPGRLPDDHQATRRGIEHALEQADLVIISGGVSVGPHDHVKSVLAELGVRERFWGVSLQPGKPTWFGNREERLVFGLPGNPVSAAVTFSLFVLPALRALQRQQHRSRLPREAELGLDVARNPRREQALRVRLEHDRGHPVAFPNGAQGSHILTSLLAADALAMVPAGDGVLTAGTPVLLEELAV